jgi:hypothetical protein
MDMPVIGIIENLQALPYADAFSEWHAHAQQCPQCAGVIQTELAGGFADVGSLCQTGQGLDDDLALITAAQHEVSLWN